MNDKQEEQDKLSRLGIPHSFVIANMPHRVELVRNATDSRGNDAFGYYTSTTSVITLGEYIMEKRGRELKVPDEQILNTFYHELFHAFNFYWNNEFSEELAQTFSNFMREFQTSKK